MGDKTDTFIQADLFSSTVKKVVPSCKCAEIKGKTVLLDSFTRIGVSTEFMDNGVFKNNCAAYVENNYCPQCGAKYKEEPK